MVFEGGTVDAHQLQLKIATLTADREVTLPDRTGTVLVVESMCHL